MILLYLSCTNRLDVRDLDISSVEVEVHDVTIDGHDDEQIDDDQEEPSQASRQAVVVTSKDAFGMEKCIVFTEHIMSLLLQLHGKKCGRSGCERNYVYKKTYVGTCLVVSWQCSAGHLGGRWASQPTCDNLRAGNLLLASSILLIFLLPYFISTKSCLLPWLWMITGKPCKRSFGRKGLGRK